MTPRSLLRLEGLLVFIIALAIYHRAGHPWWLFAVFLFAPDLFMLGYLAGPRIGARVYNLGHTYAVPAAIGALFWRFGTDSGVAVCLTWLAHIALDRALGYGLKYEEGFKATHMQRVEGP